ncbi:MAG: glycosyltransferase [Patescibacteria group bacterium]|nr:glycosyltransferase [Patescibacteria group bacterium]MCL5257833.1 glycosyltransferase [Patescibacteria group bacterium]
MKILIVSESFPPHISGVSVFVSQLTNHLIKNKNQVIVFTNSSGFKFREEEKENGRLKIFSFPSFPNPFRTKLRIALPSRKICSIIKTERPDLIHIQDPGFRSRQVIFEAKKLHLPIIVTHHFTLAMIESYLPKFLKNTGRKKTINYLKKFYAQVNLITCPSDFVKNELSSMGIEKKILVVSNGVDLEQFKVGRTVKKETPLILHVGRVDPEKNISVLIKAAELILAKVKATFIFVGDGKLLKRYRRYVKNKKLSGAIKFIGSVPPQSQKLIDLYHQAWFFWIASKAESQGIVVLEALATGLPVIGIKSGGLAEIFKDNQAGFLLENDQNKNFADKALSLIDQPQLRQKFSEEALVEAKKYSIEKTLAEYDGIYRQLVKSK